MSLDSTTCANNIRTAIETAIVNWPSRTFAADFASTYKAYSQAGVLSAGGGIAGSEDESILIDALSASDVITPMQFGAALAAYWDTCLLIPSSGSVTVSNDALSKVSEFTEAVENSITTTESIPYYKTFIDNVEAVVKTITWTCVKASPTPPTMETVS